MSLLFTQDWDVVRGKEDEYAEFVSDSFIPECNRLGLQSVGGFYVAVGVGPKVISVKSAPSLAALTSAMADERFHRLKQALKDYVVNYSSKILEPTLFPERVEYAIQKGVWKYNVYYDVNPDGRPQYEDFLRSEYLPTLADLDYVEVTQGWNVLIGGFSEAILELTFSDSVDIGRLLGNPSFRNVTYTLCRDHVRNYKSRILRTTERFDEPRWFRL
ncbi:MAG: hypothetical protein SCH98_11325 [Deferrisomatales bacterium]|nr:hypothetical protein [Deferrisomatales bacterium]